MRYCLDQEHINFLTSEETLLAWITKSIPERCTLFHRTYTDKFIKPWRLRAVYRVNGIKKKVIRTKKMPEKAQDGRYESLKETMRSQMKSAMEQGRSIIWLDEIMFSRTHYKTHEWSKRKSNIHIPYEAMGRGYTAVIAAIS